ncbi:MAG: metallophosphatase family protein [Bacteroidales bacterium]|jgi:putative phosphoesterase|nr:metallophosphatase family protein [Bacteroidales bacterium]
MKKILILSDTHGYVDNAIEHYARQVDEIWHAGDIGSCEVLQRLQACAPLKAVFGNIDSQEIRLQTQKILIFETEQIRVLLTHIGGYPPKYMPDIVKEIAKHKPHIVVAGHSHILKVMPDKNRTLLYINPGAIGNQGFHQVRTMILLTLDAGQARDVRVVEYERD